LNKIKQKKILQDKKLKTNGKFLMTHQIYFEAKRCFSEKEECNKEQLNEFIEKIEKKFSFVKQLEKKFDEVEIFVRRESADPFYDNKYYYFKNYEMKYFMLENEFFLRKKSKLINEIEIYKKDLNEIVKENIEVKNTFYKNKLANQDSNKKKEILLTKEHNIVKKYTNKIKYLERNNQYLNSVYKDLSNKIIKSLSFNSNLFKSPLIHDFSISQCKSFKNSNLKNNTDKSKNNAIQGDINNNSISINRKESNFKFNIQLYDKNILLNTIKFVPIKSEFSKKNSSQKKIFSSNKKKIINLKRSVKNKSNLENLNINEKLENFRKNSSNENYIKIDENDGIEKISLVTSFNLNENEDNLPYNKKDYSLKSVSNLNSNNHMSNKLKMSFKEKVNQIKKTNNIDKKRMNNENTDNINKSKTGNKSDLFNEISNYNVDENKNINSIICMETGLEMLPKDNLYYNDNFRKEDNNNDIVLKRKNSKCTNEKDRKNSKNNNINEDEIENENFDKNINIDVDFAIKYKSSIFTKNKEYTHDSTEKTYYNFNKVLYNKTPSPKSSPNKRNDHKEKKIETNNKVTIINLKSMNSNMKIHINNINEEKDKNENDLKNINIKINNCYNINDNSTTKYSENLVIDDNPLKKKNNLNLGKSIISVLSQKSQEIVKLELENNLENLIIKKNKEQKEIKENREIKEKMNTNNGFFSEFKKVNPFDIDNGLATNEIEIKHKTIKKEIDTNFNYDLNNKNSNDLNNSIFDYNPDEIITFKSDICINKQEADYNYHSKYSPLSSQSKFDSNSSSKVHTKTQNRHSDTIENPDIWDISCIITQTES